MWPAYYTAAKKSLPEHRAQTRLPSCTSNPQSEMIKVGLSTESHSHCELGMFEAWGPISRRLWGFKFRSDLSRFPRTVILSCGALKASSSLLSCPQGHGAYSYRLSGGNRTKSPPNAKDTALIARVFDWRTWGCILWHNAKYSFPFLLTNTNLSSPYLLPPPPPPPPHTHTHTHKAFLLLPCLTSFWELKVGIIRLRAIAHNRLY